MKSDDTAGSCQLLFRMPAIQADYKIAGNLPVDNCGKIRYTYPSHWACAHCRVGCHA